MLTVTHEPRSRPTDVCNPHFSKTSTRNPVDHWRREPLARSLTSERMASRPSAHFGGALLDAFGIVLRDARPRPKPLTLASPSVTSRRLLSQPPRCHEGRGRLRHRARERTTFRQPERLPSERALSRAFARRWFCHRSPSSRRVRSSAFAPSYLSAATLASCFRERAAFRLLQSDSARGHDREPLAHSRASLSRRGSAMLVHCKQ